MLGSILAQFSIMTNNSLFPCFRTNWFIKQK